MSGKHVLSHLSVFCKRILAMGGLVPISGRIWRVAEQPDGDFDECDSCIARAFQPAAGEGFRAGAVSAPGPERQGADHGLRAGLVGAAPAAGPT